MSSLGTSSRGLLEIGKFALYVTVPVVATYCFATDSKTLHKLMAFVNQARHLSILAYTLQLLHGEQKLNIPMGEILYLTITESVTNNELYAAFLCSLSARGSSPSFTRGTQGDGPTSCSQEQQPMNNSQCKFKVFAGKRMMLFAG
ncbi:hypothetical protein C4D60_Mb09t21940 [Musa balbisiana]|uniref:Uncharacterized protein n=1 Tax=Musa balbisiana TaxID=52838 RepID=A0A4S8II85_MUSBA|nr:hypothetical protein C4D60_Mb09t21940 [Musa balbisiana]